MYGTNPYVVVTKKGYTKHYYAGTERLATVIGSGVVVASISCIAVGARDRKYASKIYDTKHCSPETPLTFSIQSSSNGLGLAMQF